MPAFKRLPLISVILWAVFLLGGCATLPNVAEIIEDVPTQERQPEIVGAKGTLSELAGRKIIRRIKRFSGAGDIIGKQALALEDVTGKQLIAGNKVTLLIDGPATYAAMLKAVRDAKHNINLETFIFEDDEIGRLFAEEFLKKQAEGVQVNIIYDSFGSKKTPSAFFDRLSQSGINILAFNPVSPLHSDWQPHFARRDHRKILVVDGLIAFTGGVNISHVYSSSLSGLSYDDEDREIKKEDTANPWRDTHVQVEGPAVAEFQKLFRETWMQHRPELQGNDYFPELKREESDLVQVIGSTPGELNRGTFIMYVASFVNAQRSIHLTTPYFVPDDQALSALLDAAGRGLDVRIILPEISDSRIALYAGRYEYSTLLKAGVKLYERRHKMMHAKTVVVDGVWSTVGSTNMDLWSFLHNNEVNAVIIGVDFAAGMEALFERDLKQSKEVLPEEWKKRPLLPRIREWFAHLLRRYL